MTRKKVVIVICSLFLLVIIGFTANYFRPVKRKVRHYNKGLIYLQKSKYQAAIREFKSALAISKSIVVQMHLAKAYIRNENFKKAENELKNIIQQNEKHKDAHITLTNLYLQQEKHVKAINSINKLLESAGKSAELLNVKAFVYLTKKDWDLAYKYLLEAKEIDNNNEITHYYLGQVEWQMGNKSKVLQILEEYLQRTPKSDKIRLLLASYYYSLEDQLKAIEHFSILEKKRAKIDAPFLSTYARSLLQAGKVQSAYEIADQCLKKNINSSQRFIMTYIRGVGYLSQKKYELASKDFQWVTGMDPDFASGRYYMGLVYLLKKNYLLANEELQKAIELDPEATNIHQILIKSYAVEGKLEEGLKVCDEILRISNENIAALNIKARIFFLMGETEKSKALYNRITQISPKSAKSEIQLALIDIKNKKESKAISRLKKALRKTPNDPSISLLLTQVYFSQRNLISALKYLNMSTQLGKNRSPSARRILAEIRVSQKHYDLAAKEYEELLRDFPRNDEYCLRLASLYFQQGKRKDALKLLKNKNKNPSTHTNYALLYAQIYLAEKRYNYSIEIIDKYGSENVNLQVLKGNILSFLKKYKQAIEAYQIAKTINNKLPIELLLAFCYYHQKDWVLAIKNLKIYIKNTPNILSKTFLAILYLYNNNINLAIETAEEVIDQNKNSDFAHLIRANIFLMQRNKAQAIEQIQQLRKEKVFMRQHFTTLINDSYESKRHFLPLLDGLIFEKIASSQEQVISRYEDILRELDSHYLAKYYYSIYLYKVAKTQDVIKHLQQLIQQGNLSEQAYLILAKLYLQKKDIKQGKQFYSKVLKINPQNSQALITLGMINEKQKNYKEAISYYEKVISPSQLEKKSKIIALNNLAYFYAKKSNIKKAIFYAKKAYSLSPHSWEIADTLGYIYYKGGKFKQAIKYLTYASQLYPRSSEVYFHLAETYYKLGNKATCRIYLEQAFRINNRFFSRQKALKMRKVIKF